MRLNLYELDTTLDLKLTAPSRPTFMTAVRPHLYVHLNPAGSLIMQLRDSAGTTLLATSDTVAISTITGSNYFHGYVRFDLNYGLMADTTYTFRLTSSGYTYNVNSFVGWCNDFDLRKYSVANAIAPAEGYSAPFDMELWEIKTIQKGDIL